MLFLMSAMIALRTRVAALRIRGELAPPLPQYDSSVPLAAKGLAGGVR
jgi:hypothetical protein